MHAGRRGGGEQAVERAGDGQLRAGQDRGRRAGAGNGAAHAAVHRHGGQPHLVFLLALRGGRQSTAA